MLGPEVEKVRLIDITTDPELEARYGLKIPVLVIDGDVVCMYRVDSERVRAHLD
ncbi:MAG: glutaredoxin family protein [Steroidobacteraceae bacterium]